MPIKRVQLPDGKIIRVEVPDGASDEDVLEFAAMSASTKPDQAVDLSPPNLFKTMGEAATRQAKSLLNFPDPYALTDKGVSDERMRDIINTAAAASIPASMVNTAAKRLILGAGTGAAHGNTIEDQVKGGAQGLALAGMFETLPAVQGILQAGKRAAYDPTWNPENVVGQTLKRMAADPENPQVLDSTIRALENPQTLVRGSNPTTPQASRNGGLWALYKSVMAREPAADRAITDAQNLARNKAFKELGVGENAGSSGAALKQSAVADLNKAERVLEGTPINLKGVLDEVDDLLESGAAKTPQIRTQLESIKRNLFARTAEEPVQPTQGTGYKYEKPSINYETDDLIAAIRKLGGINKASAERIHGNRLWEDTVNTPNPRLGPVWRNGDAGQSLDDLAKSLHDHGYLQEPDPRELVDTLYHHGQGNIDAASMFSNRKGDFSEFDTPRNEHDSLMSSLDSLISELRARNAPKPAQQRELETALEKVQGIRTAIGRAVYNENGVKIAGPIGTQLSGISGQITNKLDDAIEDALWSTGNKGLHQDFKEKYALGSRLEQRASTLRDLMTKGSSPGELPVVGKLDDGAYGPTGEYQDGDILSVKLSNVLRGKDKTAANARRLLTPTQLERIDAINSDIRRAIPKDVKRGSDTFQNMATDYILSDILGPTGAGSSFFGGLTKGVTNAVSNAIPSFVAKAVPSANPMENEVLRKILVQAMRDPKFAARIMRSASTRPLISTDIPARIGPSLIDYLEGNQR